MGKLCPCGHWRPAQPDSNSILTFSSQPLHPEKWQTTHRLLEVLSRNNTHHFCPSSISQHKSHDHAQLKGGKEVPPWAARQEAAYSWQKNCWLPSRIAGQSWNNWWENRQNREHKSVMTELAPNGVAQLAGLRPTKRGVTAFIPSQSGHMPALQVGPLVSTHSEAIDGCFSPFLPPSLPLSLKTNKWKL